MIQITKMCEDMKKAVDCFGELDGSCGELSDRHAAQAQQGVQTLSQMYDITCATLGQKNEGRYQESENQVLASLKRSRRGTRWINCYRDECGPLRSFYKTPLESRGWFFWRECKCQCKPNSSRC